jgi:hypothetical protein
MSFALELRNPAVVNFVTATAYTRPEQVQSVLSGLKREDVRLVVWYSDLPLSGSPGNQLAPLLDYLQAHYRVVKVFGDRDRVWEKKPGK